jgi:hypothetical protein
VKCGQGVGYTTLATLISLVVAFIILGKVHADASKCITSDGCVHGLFVKGAANITRICVNIPNLTVSFY